MQQASVEAALETSSEAGTYNAGCGRDVVTFVQLLAAAPSVRDSSSANLPPSIGNQELDAFLATLNQLLACFPGPQVPDNTTSSSTADCGGTKHVSGNHPNLPSLRPRTNRHGGRAGVPGGVERFVRLMLLMATALLVVSLIPLQQTPVAGGGTQGQLGPQDMQLVPFQLQHTQSVLDIPNAQLYQSVSPCTARFFTSSPGVAVPEMWPSAGPSQVAKSEPADVTFGGVLADEGVVSVLQAIDDREDIEGLQSAKQHGMLVVHAASKRRLAGNPVS